MDAPLVLLLLVGVVTADVGLGYKYKIPQYKYEAPSTKFGSTSNQYSSAYTSNLGSGSVGSSLDSGSLYGGLASSNLGFGNFGYGRYGSGSYGLDSFESSTLTPTLVSSTIAPSLVTTGLDGGLASSNLGFGNFGYGKYGSGSYGVDSLESSTLAPTLVTSTFAPSLVTSGLDSSFTNFGSTYFPSSGASGYSTVRPLYQYSSSGLNSGYQTQYATANQFQSADQDKYLYRIQQQPTQVFKHFYVHAAPEEPEEPLPRTPIVLPPAQKHYKIIFVKAPTESRRTQTVIPVQPQNEEKTIVYVLVKKPEEQREVIVPKIEQKPPSKPEVFFIKYKNKEDSQSVIDNIVKDYNKGEQVSIVNSAANDEIYNDASGVAVGSGIAVGSAVSDGSYNTASGYGEGASIVGSDISSGIYDIGSSISSGASSTYGNSGSLFNTGHDHLQYDTASQSESTTASSFNGYNGLGAGYSLATASTGADFNDISSTVAPLVTSTISPIAVSTTASNIGYDAAKAISTSQGIPHETYGPPKFRNF